MLHEFAYMPLGRYMEDEKKADLAIEFFDRALDLDPNREDIRDLLQKVKHLAQVSVCFI